MIEIVRYNDNAVEVLTLERSDKGSRKIRGLASCYYDGTPNTEYQLAENLYERIQRGAWSDRLGDDVAARVNHDEKLQVGRTPKSLNLWESQRGLEYEITLPNTSKANDLWEECTADIIRGSSFRALVDTDNPSQVEYQRDGTKRVMLIKRFEKLVDVAPVYKSAYKGTEATAIMRSFEDWELRQKTNEIYERMKKLGI